MSSKQGFVDAVANMRPSVLDDVLSSLPARGEASLCHGSIS